MAVIRGGEHNCTKWLSNKIHCALCDAPVEDVHHIAEQREANETGHIDHFHKNHKYNLIPLCKQHHQMVHEGKIMISGFVMTDEGLKLHYRFVIRDS